MARQVFSLKWFALFFNFVITLIGAVIVALSLRMLFDPEYSYLLAQNGLYVGAQVMAGAGAVLFFVGVIGCISILVHNVGMMFGFVAILLLLIGAEIACGVVAYSGQADFQDKVQLKIRWAVEEHYGNDNANTTIMDLIQTGWECCGSNSYTSWTNSRYGRRHVPLTTTPTNIFYVPKSCCINSESKECADIFVNGINGITQSVDGILHKNGCGHKLAVAINTYATYLYSFGTGLVLVQIVALTLTACFICMVRSNHSSNRFLSRKNYYGNETAASAAMLNSAESSKCATPNFVASRSTLNLEPAVPTSSLV